jgi:hypothetical protein
MYQENNVATTSGLDIRIVNPGAPIWGMVGGQGTLASLELHSWAVANGINVVAVHESVMENNFRFYAGLSQADPRPVIAERCEVIWEQFPNVPVFNYCVTGNYGVPDIRDLVSRPDQLVSVIEWLKERPAFKSLPAFATLFTSEWLGQEGFKVGSLSQQETFMMPAIGAAKYGDASIWAVAARQYAGSQPMLALCTEGPLVAKAAGIPCVDPFKVMLTA